MALTLKRSSVAVQVAEALRSEIRRGAWKEWIPSERELSQTLRVCRTTCRAGLKMLYRERLLLPEIGRGIRVNRAFIRQAHGAVKSARSVGIVMPNDVRVLRPLLLLIIDELTITRHSIGRNPIRRWRNWSTPFPTIAGF